MAEKILINKLKGVRSLTFDIPSPGVYLIAGVNGSGKTTLLGCLHRIGYPAAFSTYFPKVYGDRFDDLTSSSITYSVNKRSVTYRHAGQRWVPLPRRNADVLRDFGFPDVVYQGATADRITPAPDGLGKWLRPAPDDLRTALNDIFNTKKFNRLWYTNRTRGVGNRAHLLRTRDKPSTKYHTEKNFGLGELCILNLVRKLLECRNNSLVLIDEVEMALHSQAQIRFVRFLRGVAKEKGLTVLVSTHSSTLLKSVPRKDILFLHRDTLEGDTKVIEGCFPAFALGQIGEGEERDPDVYIIVEDDAAAICAETLV